MLWMERRKKRKFWTCSHNIVHISFYFLHISFLPTKHITCFWHISEFWSGVHFRKKLVFLLRLYKLLDKILYTKDKWSIKTYLHLKIGSHFNKYVLHISMFLKVFTSHKKRAGHLHKKYNQSSTSSEILR